MRWMVFAYDMKDLPRAKCVFKSSAPTKERAIRAAESQWLLVEFCADDDDPITDAYLLQFFGPDEVRVMNDPKRYVSIVNIVVAILVIALLAWMVIDKRSSGYGPNDSHPKNLNPRDGD